MKKDEIYETALAQLEHLTGIGRQAIERGRDEEASDARYVLVATLQRLLTDTDLAQRLGRTKQGIGHIRRNEKKRRKWMVERNLKELGQQMESIYLVRD